METTQPLLRREAQRARYRHAWWLALAAGVAGNGLLVLAMWAAAPRPAPAEVSVMPAPVVAPTPTVVVSPPIAPPVVVVVQAAAPAAAAAFAAFGDLGPCPAPHTARPSGALRQPRLDAPIAGFAGAPTDSRKIAVWTDEEVHVSADGGGSWDRVLDGPGGVLDVSFDCHGRVLALREGNGLGLRDGAREAWRTVPAMSMRAGDEAEPRYAPKLVGGGRAMAVVGTREDDAGEAWAALSDDGGATWRHVSLGWYEGLASAAWHRDTLQVALPWTDCRDEGIRLVTVTARGTRAEEIDEWAQQVALDRGAVLGLSWQCPEPGRDALAVEDQLCAWRDGVGWRSLSLGPVADDGGDGGDGGYALTLVDGPADVIVHGASVQAIGGRKLGRAREWPLGADALGTDLAGRLWGKDADGSLIRR